MYAIYGNIYHQYTPMLAYILYMDPMGKGVFHVLRIFFSWAQDVGLQHLVIAAVQEDRARVLRNVGTSDEINGEMMIKMMIQTNKYG